MIYSHLNYYISQTCPPAVQRVAHWNWSYWINLQNWWVLRTELFSVRLRVAIVFVWPGIIGSIEYMLDWDPTSCTVWCTRPVWASLRGWLIECTWAIGKLEFANSWAFAIARFILALCSSIPELLAPLLAEVLPFTFRAVSAWVQLLPLDALFIFHAPGPVHVLASAHARLPVWTVAASAAQGEWRAEFIFGVGFAGRGWQIPYW